MTGLDLDLFGGPGGWDTGALVLGLRPVGIELDAAACATRAAAGHLTIRADVAAFPVGQLAGRVRGTAGSPPCTTFSAAGDQAGNVIAALLDDLVREMLAGRDHRQAYAERMAGELTESEWAADMEPAKRAAKIRTAVRSACLVAQPARFIAACSPEWVALEQVPPVLPLWRVYAEELTARRYSAWCGILNAADYGVPQTRQRAILIASRVRKVGRPEPTHYDPRKGDQLWGTPWVSMAQALGWGATERSAPTVTAGGTSTGGAEPFGHRDRDALIAEQEAGAWALRMGNQDNATVRPAPAPAPAPAIAFGHNSASMQWVLRREVAESERDSHRDRPIDEPAVTITAGGSGSGSGNGAGLRWVRTSFGEPSGDITLHTNRGQEPDGTRQTVDPSTAPAPALTAKSGGQWVVKRGRGRSERYGEYGERALDEPAPTVSAGSGGSGARMAWSLQMDTQAKATLPRPADEPAPTIQFAHRANLAQRVTERPATTVQGDPRVGRPGHKDRDAGTWEAQFEQDSVRITVQEAAILQSFPADYPWAGSKTKQFEQVGNAVPPVLAMHVLAEATGLPLPDELREAP